MKKKLKKLLKVKNVFVSNDDVYIRLTKLQKAIEKNINSLGVDNMLELPDYILAESIVGTLKEWYKSKYNNKHKGDKK